jgi:hypothetical protein
MSECYLVISRDEMKQGLSRSISAAFPGDADAEER